MLSEGKPASLPQVSVSCTLYGEGVRKHQVWLIRNKCIYGLATERLAIDYELAFMLHCMISRALSHLNLTIILKGMFIGIVSISPIGDWVAERLTGFPQTKLPIVARLGRQSSCPLEHNYLFPSTT